jgi:hypothetical protein
MRVMAGYEKASKPRARFRYLLQEFRWTPAVTIRHRPRAAEQKDGPLVRPYRLLHRYRFRHGRESAPVLT